MSLAATALRKAAAVSDHGILGTIVTEPALHRLADWVEGDDDE